MDKKQFVAPAIAVAIAVLVAQAFFLIDTGRQTAPIKRAQEQNAGANAPMERNASPGTVPNGDGGASLPKNQQ